MSCICGGRPSGPFPMDGYIAVGFGIAQVTRDGQVIYDEMEICRNHERDHGPECGDGPALWKGEDAEKAASTDPDHEWLIIIASPLSGGTWQRIGARTWECIESNRGFA